MVYESLDKDPRYFLAVALLSVEYAEEAEIASFTHDGSFFHSLSPLSTSATETQVKKLFTGVDYTFGVQQVEDEVLILHWLF